mmetsp:Transcript_5390/g.12451  ORF Transcript_5390/g.12451 Transcript_5390/m.12451 type:complete len:126 (-) Transcript_5390:472-849(-)
MRVENTLAERVTVLVVLVLLLVVVIFATGEEKQLCPASRLCPKQTKDTDGIGETRPLEARPTAKDLAEEDADGRAWEPRHAAARHLRYCKVPYAHQLVRSNTTRQALACLPCRSLSRSVDRSLST